MKFTAGYSSPVGELLLASDGERLTGLWLAGQKYYASGVEQGGCSQGCLPLFVQAKHWLDEYFAGKDPDPADIPLALHGSEYRRRIWTLLREIPYGELTTYGQLAKNYQLRYGCATSPRAVGGAVGHNPISIIVPCHRVVGADGGITGYAGGVEKKRFLLCLEGSE